MARIVEITEASLSVASSRMMIDFAPGALATEISFIFTGSPWRVTIFVFFNLPKFDASDVSISALSTLAKMTITESF